MGGVQEEVAEAQDGSDSVAVHHHGKKHTRRSHAKMDSDAADQDYVNHEKNDGALPVQDVGAREAYSGHNMDQH
jgi:hypothetical protein